VLVHAYGFLAAFAAGVALRRVEATHSGGEAPPDVAALSATGAAEEVATDPDKAPAFMAQAVLGFNEQLERVTEVGVVVLIGGMLSARYLPGDAIWFVPLLLLVIRPAAVLLGLVGSPVNDVQRGLICWFGVRGAGSLYYLAYAIQRGVQGEWAERLTGLVLTAVAVSIVVHGVSVTPLMNRYAALMRLRRARRAATRETGASREGAAASRPDTTAP
jgi:sodium/hydrogen antiporter